MIDRLTKQVESNIYFKDRTLAVFYFDNAKGNKWYANSIKRQAKKLGIKVEVYKGNADTEFLEQVKRSDKALLLKPEINSNTYQLCKNHTLKTDKDVEGEIQSPTVEAVSKAVEDLGARQDILLIGRSKDLGIPIALDLISKDHTVTVAHSKSGIHLSTTYSTIINLAPIRNLKVESLDLIDVAGTIEEHRSNKIIKNIGKLTTMILFQKLMEG